MNIRNLILKILLVVLATSSMNAQTYFIYRGDTINRTDENNLIYGHWIYFMDFETNSVRYTVDTIRPRIISEGNYKIIQIQKENIIKITQEKDFTEKFTTGWITLADSSCFSYSSNYKDYYSVTEGMWLSYNPNYGDTNELRSINYYKNGDLVKSQDFEKGIPKELTIFYKNKMDKYLNCEPYVYERWIGNPDGTSKTIYYPDKKLSISKNFLSLNTPLNTNQVDSVILTSNSEDTLKINFNSNCKNISYFVNDKEIINHKIVLSPKKTITLKFRFSPIGNMAFQCDEKVVFYDSLKTILGEINLTSRAIHQSVKKKDVKKFVQEKDKL